MVDTHQKRIVRLHNTAIVLKRLGGPFPCEELTAICVSSHYEEISDTIGWHPPSKSKKIFSLPMKILFIVGSAIKTLVAIVIDAIMRNYFTFCRQTDLMSVPIRNFG
jgi:hypothetical protein